VAQVEVYENRYEGGGHLSFACPAGVPPRDILDAGLAFAKRSDKLEVDDWRLIEDDEKPLAQTQGRELLVSISDRGGEWRHSHRCPVAAHGSYEEAVDCARRWLANWLRRYREDAEFVEGVREFVSYSDSEIAAAQREGRFVVHPDGLFEIEKRE
jgi:hypothetical protein